MNEYGFFLGEELSLHDSTALIQVEGLGIRGLDVSGKTPLNNIEEYASKPVLHKAKSLASMMVKSRIADRDLEPMSLHKGPR